MKAKKYKTREEAVAAIKLAIAKKNEYVAHVQRVWAEQHLQQLQSTK